MSQQSCTEAQISYICIRNTFGMRRRIAFISSIHFALVHAKAEHLSVVVGLVHPSGTFSDVARRARGSCAFPKEAVSLCPRFPFSSRHDRSHTHDHYHRHHEHAAIISSEAHHRPHQNLSLRPQCTIPSPSRLFPRTSLVIHHVIR